MRLASFLTDPREIFRQLLINTAIFLASFAIYYVHYMATLHGLVDKDGDPFGRDFVAFYNAAQMLRVGDVAGIYSPEAFTKGLTQLFGSSLNLYWGYPPIFLFLLWPLTMLGYKAAYVAWLLMNIVAFVVAAFWRTKLDGSWRWIAFSAPAVLIELFIGQNGLLTAAILIGGFRLLKSEPLWAGVVFGLLAYKPQFAILLPFILLALGQRKAFLTAALTLATLVLLSAMAFGCESWILFFHNMWHYQSQIMWLGHEKMITVFSATQSLGGSRPVGAVLQGAATVATVIFLCRALMRRRDAHWSEWLLLCAPAFYLATPYAFTYDMCILSTAWLLWFSYRPHAPVPAVHTALWLLLWYLPIVSQSLNEHHLPIAPALFAAVFFLGLRKKS